MTDRTQSARDKGEFQRLARLVTDALTKYDEVRAVCLAGSVARGNHQSDSDLDLIVITEQRLRRSDLLGRLPEGLRDGRVSLLSFSREQWLEEARDGSLFVHHVRLEGQPLFDPEGVLRQGLALSAARAPNVARELRRQLNRLRLYREPERLNGQHLFALSHLYAIGKAVAIARCVGLGENTFVKEHALSRLAARRPDLASDVAVIERLRPFYDLTRDRESGPLPFEPVGAAPEVVRARRSIERLAHG